VFPAWDILRKQFRHRYAIQVFDDGRMLSRNLVQVAEIWAPDASGLRLTLRGGSYGDLHEFRAATEGMTFLRGVGLPGRAWEEGRPVVLNHFRGGSGFVRVEAAAKAGLVAGVGFPIFHGRKCVAVCVLLFGGKESKTGVVEVWSPNGSSGQLSLVSGYHGHHDSFRRASALMKIPVGAGLPGLVYERGVPVLTDDLQDAGVFIRSAAAESASLTFGLGIPMFSADGVLSSVLVMLAGLRAPMARIVEIWVPDATGTSLVLDSAAYHHAEPPPENSRPTSYRRGEGLPGSIWHYQMPMVFDTSPPRAPDLTGTLGHRGLEMGIGLPILRGGELVAVVLLLS
jgi:hypothetical protein